METIRYHTEGRRQPMLIGKDSAGHKIWGGPYTVYQLLGLLLVPALASTSSIWGPDLTPLAAGVTIAGLTALTVWGLGLVDFTRNPFHAATSMGTLLRSAVGGPDRRLTRGTLTKGRAHTVLLAGTDHPPRADQTTPGGQEPDPAPLPAATPAAAQPLLSNPPPLPPSRPALPPSRPALPPGSAPGPTPAPASEPPTSEVAPMTVRSPLDQFLAAATRSGDADS